MIPLVIGVTGHRDLLKQDIPTLESAVRNILSNLRSKFPSIPLLVLSPLAEGADQLVARVAVADPFNAQLIIPLPMPVEDYEKSFSEEGRISLHTLLKHGIQFVLPSEEAPLLNFGKKNINRSDPYVRNGIWIIRNCQILIALWDGEKENELTGGTSQIVRFAREGVSPCSDHPSASLDDLDTCLVYHVLTPRKINPKLEGKTGATQLLSENKRHETASQSLNLLNTQKKIEDFNAQAARLRKKIPKKLEESRYGILQGNESSQISGAAKPLLDFCAATDVLAIYYRSLSVLSLRSLFAFAVIAFLGFEIYAHLLSVPWVLAVYPAMLFGAYLIYLFAGPIHDVQNKHFDYRSLAEALRVQLFWQIAGIHDCVADFYLHRQRSELVWIREAVRNCYIASLAHETSKSKEKNEITKVSIVYRLWIRNQKDYFINRSQVDHRKCVLYERWILFFFLSGIVLSLVALFADPMFQGRPIGKLLHHILIVMMGLCPAIAAALGGYAQKMAFSEQTKRYEWSRDLFQKAEERLNQLIIENDKDTALLLIRELGKAALEENADWIILHRDRPLEVPKGG